MAEQGICAHWKYKEGRLGADSEDGRIAWLRQLVEWQRDMKDPSDFLATLKIDLYPEEVYVVTPQGKLLVLPRAATPVDFAYAIHTEVGHCCVGAKANGRIVPLSYHLRNGDIVEILTKPNRTPSHGWLSSVNTSRARNKIKHWFSTQQREKAEQIGLKLLEKEARRARVSLGGFDDQVLAVLHKEYGVRSLKDLYAALGYGKYSAHNIITQLFPSLDKSVASIKTSLITSSVKSDFSDSSVQALSVKGSDDILVYRAHCCSPIKGEPIVGYVTRGKGVSVHSATCSNVQKLLYETDRRMDVKWSSESENTYRTHLVIQLHDRPGILADLSAAISGQNVNISSVESHQGQGKNSLAAVEMILEVKNIDQLNRSIDELKKIAGVRHVRRSRRK